MNADSKENDKAPVLYKSFLEREYLFFCNEMMWLSKKKNRGYDLLSEQSESN